MIEELSGKALAVVPVAGPWRGDTVLDLVEAAASTAPASVLVANLRSGALWGSRPPAAALLGHLAGAPVEPPPPDWDAGHFVTMVAGIRGGRRALVLVRDTYPTLGWGGYHLQPAEALALSRGDGREGRRPLHLPERGGAGASESSRRCGLRAPSLGQRDARSARGDERRQTAFTTLSARHAVTRSR